MHSTRRSKRHRRMRVREFVTSPRPLQEIMDDISQRAESRGLTPQILQSLLNEP